MPRPNLKKQAAQQANAEYNPQIRSVRRETRNQVRSVQSAGPALEASLGRTGQQLRHVGLAPDDLAIALRELAYRTADVGASTALQSQQIRQEGQGQIVDLLASRGAAQRSALSSLQNAAAERRQDVSDEEAAEVRGLRMDILREQAEKSLGLGDYADDGGNGMTPTQTREAKDSHHNAAFYAKQYFQASRGGLTDDKTGEVIIPEGAQNWDDSTWNALVEKVASQKGVDTVEDAQRAVQAIRAHVDGEGGGEALDLLGLIGRTAAATAPAVLPKPLAQVAQFGNQLMRR